MVNLDELFKLRRAEMIPIAGDNLVKTPTLAEYLSGAVNPFNSAHDRNVAEWMASNNDASYFASGPSIERIRQIIEESNK